MLKGTLNQQAVVDIATQQEICKALWPKFYYLDAEIDDLDMSYYFCYYVRQCQDALADQGRHVQARTHQDIIDIVHQIEADIPRERIRESLRSQLSKHGGRNENEILDASIDLAARLYSMISIASSEPRFPRQIQVRWEEGSLINRLAAHFSVPQILGSDGVKLDPIFNAANLDRMAGIRIRPTDNLADHLRMVDQEDKVVAVFHHVSFLNRQTITIYPKGLAEETLRTLSILFPQHDRNTHKWIQKQIGRFDKALLKCEPLRLEDRQVEKFDFWHDRLIVLKQAFDHSRPATMSQWWFDRRNGVQWYTFWIAAWVLLLTIFFGIVQSIEGALQVYKAYHPSP